MSSLLLTTKLLWERMFICRFDVKAELWVPKGNVVQPHCRQLIRGWEHLHSFFKTCCSCQELIILVLEADTFSLCSTARLPTKLIVLAAFTSISEIFFILFPLKGEQSGSSLLLRMWDMTNTSRKQQ